MKSIISWIIATVLMIAICVLMVHISIKYEHETLAYRALRNMKWQEVKQ